MEQQEIPLAFRPEYLDFVERQIKRNMTISFMNGDNKFLDLNKGKHPNNTGIKDFSLDERENITALRINLGRDQITINRKIGDKNYVEGFFYHRMRRMSHGRFVKKEAKLNLRSDSMILTEEFGFCYNAQGDAVEYAYNYEDILRQLYSRKEKTDRIQKKIDIINACLRLERGEDIGFEGTEEQFFAMSIGYLQDLKPTLDNRVKFEEEIENIIASKLTFNITRDKQSVNLLDLGYGINEFHKLTDDEMDIFVDRHEKEEDGAIHLIKSEHHKYLDYLKEKKVYDDVQEERKTNPTRKDIEEPLEVERPFIPRLPYAGTQPKIIFRIRESGTIG